MAALAFISTAYSILTQVGYALAFLWVVILAAFCVAVVALIIHGFFSGRRIARAIEQLTEKQHDDIFRGIEECGNEAPQSCLLVKTRATTTDTTNVIVIPTWIPDFPWAGQSISIEVEADNPDEPTVSLASARSDTSHLGGAVYRVVKVPRVRGKSGKSANVFAPRRYLSKNPAIGAAFGAISERDQIEIMETDLLPEYKTVRIATSPLWIQGPETKRCAACSRKMRLIAQIPVNECAAVRGDLINLYVFGCERHPDVIESVTQMF